MRLLEGADIYQVAKTCRASVGLIEKFYAGHLKTTIDAAALNVRRQPPTPDLGIGADSGTVRRSDRQAADNGYLRQFETVSEGGHAPARARKACAVARVKRPLPTPLGLSGGLLTGRGQRLPPAVSISALAPSPGARSQLRVMSGSVAELRGRLARCAIRRVWRQRHGVGGRPVGLSCDQRAAGSVPRSPTSADCCARGNRP